MWDRPASIGTVAGVYTRSTSNGYTMTMTMSANGQLTASDSRGCVINGVVGVPDATHNLYRIDATVTSCGSLDGTYSGMGALLDADAMTDWMTAMHPLEHGGHSHGGPMMGGSPMMGRNTVPTGQRNLFLFRPRATCEVARRLRGSELRRQDPHAHTHPSCCIARPACQIFCMCWILSPLKNITYT